AIVKTLVDLAKSHVQRPDLLLRPMAVGHVVAFRDDEMDMALLVPDGRQRPIEESHFALRGEIGQLPPDRAAGGGLEEIRFEEFLDLRGAIPPGHLPVKTPED